MSNLILILHGWGGNKPSHWQEHLYTTLTEAGATVHYPKMPDPTAPDRDAWLAVIGETLNEIAATKGDQKLTVVTHSLGGINWLHYAASENAIPNIADRVLLVAPPYVIREIPPTDAPPSVSTFFPPPLSKEGVRNVAKETVFVASDNDDYATFEQTKAYADRLDLPIYLLSGAGHISPYWGYGEWPWVADWCLGNADLPPMPRFIAAE